MKVWLILSMVAISLLATPTANAFDDSAGGFGWLKSKAVRHAGFIHFHGPLYNYGPYYGGPGYQTMNVHPGFHNGYHPAYPQAVYGGGYGYATSAPSVGVAAGISSSSHYNSMMPSEPANLYPNYLSSPAWTPIR